MSNHLKIEVSRVSSHTRHDNSKAGSSPETHEVFPRSISARMLSEYEFADDRGRTEMIPRIIKASLGKSGGDNWQRAVKSAYLRWVESGTDEIPVLPPKYDLGYARKALSFMINGDVLRGVEKFKKPKLPSFVIQEVKITCPADCAFRLNGQITSIKFWMFRDALPLGHRGPFLTGIYKYAMAKRFPGANAVVVDVLNRTFATNSESYENLETQLTTLVIDLNQRWDAFETRKRA